MQHARCPTRRKIKGKTIQKKREFFQNIIDTRPAYLIQKDGLTFSSLPGLPIQTNMSIMSRSTILLLFLCQTLVGSVPIVQEWGPTDKLRLRKGGDPLDFFGTAIDVAGDTLASGAIGDSDRGTASGAVYVYTKGDRRKWSLQQKLVANDGQQQDYENDGFGSSISLLPDLIAIGSPQRGVLLGDTPGSVYIFRRSNGVWTQTQIIDGTGAIDNDLFGGAVKFVDETTLIVGAPVQSGLNRPGAVYVFQVDGNGMFLQTDKVLGSQAVGNDFFGFSLDSDGTRVIVGAPGDDDNGPDTGSAYIFDLNAGELVETTRMVAEFGLAGDEFGFSVAIGPIVAAVGSRSDNDNFIGNSAGSVFVYDLDPITFLWEFSQKITRTNPLSRITGRAATGLLGSSLAIDGEFLAIGAPGWDGVAYKNVGRVFIYKKHSRSGEWRSTEMVGACGEVPREDKFATSLAIDATTGTMVAGAIEGGRRTEDGSPGTVIIFERRPFSKVLLVQRFRCWFP